MMQKQNKIAELAQIAEEVRKLTNSPLYQVHMG